MEFLRKVIFNNLIKFIETIISLMRVLVYSSANAKLKHLKADAGTKCYILGNGPSLKENLLNDLDFIKTQQVFAVNEFAKSEYYEVLAPKYYVLADPSYWNERDIYQQFYDMGMLVLNALRDKTTWPMYLIAPNGAFKSKMFSSFFESNKNIALINYNEASIKGFTSTSHYLYKNYWGMPTLQNVLIGCVYIAINMEFEEINILGADHSWTQNLMVNENNEVIQADNHFYDSKKVYVPFRHAYGELYKMHEILRDFAQMFESYCLLNTYAIYRKVKIYNCTKNSFIDAFERKEIKSVNNIRQIDTVTSN